MHPDLKSCSDSRIHYPFYKACFASLRTLASNLLHMSSLDLLAVIWNITLDSTETEQLRRSLPFTLGELTPHSVSTSLDGSTVFDFVEIRLPTMPGADCKEKDADILKVLLLHIRGYPHDDASFKVTEPFIEHRNNLERICTRDVQCPGC